MNVNNIMNYGDGYTTWNAFMQHPELGKRYRGDMSEKYAKVKKNKNIMSQLEGYVSKYYGVPTKTKTDIADLEKFMNTQRHKNIQFNKKMTDYFNPGRKIDNSDCCNVLKSELENFENDILKKNMEINMKIDDIYKNLDIPGREKQKKLVDELKKEYDKELKEEEEKVKKEEVKKEKIKKLIEESKEKPLTKKQKKKLEKELEEFQRKREEDFEKNLEKRFYDIFKYHPYETEEEELLRLQKQYENIYGNEDIEDFIKREVAQIRELDEQHYRDALHRIYSNYNQRRMMFNISKETAKKFKETERRIEEDKNRIVEYNPNMLLNEKFNKNYQYLLALGLNKNILDNLIQTYLEYYNNTRNYNNLIKELKDEYAITNDNSTLIFLEKVKEELSSLKKIAYNEINGIIKIIKRSNFPSYEHLVEVLNILCRTIFNNNPKLLSKCTQLFI